ncbi:LamG domain-containing protein [Limnoglobus roseus]|uniref:LamG domain-containing protein n=1 Tax=Limnoglobus roseus TaxID=2598579 RepID=UPI00143D207C|nr:LamG domain-containing protein [Limnoglobus roseus]
MAPVTYLGPVATSAMMPNSQNTTASTKIMTRKAHYARDSITSLQLIYPNWRVDVSTGTLGAEVGVGNSIDVKSWVEYPVGTYTPVLFSGSATATIADFTQRLSDTTALTIPDGALFYTWTYAAPTTGNNFPYFGTTLTGNPLYYTGGGSEAAVMGTSGVPTTPGAITDNGLGKRGYWPIAILGQTAKETYFLVGDSRQQGALDVADSAYNLGGIARSIGDTRAYINVGVSADQLSSFVTSHSMRYALSQYCTTVINEYGINGIISRGVGSIEGLQNYQKRATYLFNGKRYLRATYEPIDSSTDLFATLANQTFIGSQNTPRINYNDWARTQPDSVVSLDVASALESSLDSGKWVVNGTANYATADGTHANQNGSLLVKSAGVISPAAIEAVAPVSVSPLSMTMSSISGTAVTYATGKFGNAVNAGYPYFFGVIPGSPSYTFEGWASCASAPGATAYVMGGGPAAITVAPTTGFVGIQTGDGTSTVSTTAICDGTYHHLAVTVSNTGLTTLYSDGVSAASFNPGPWIQQNWKAEGRPFQLRAFSQSTPAASSVFAGTVDEVAVWSGVKYTGAFTPPSSAYTGSEPNLLSLWHLDGNLSGVAGSAFLAQNDNANPNLFAANDNWPAVWARHRRA